MIRLIKTGNVEKKTSAQIKSTRVGIGFEKLDRALFEPENAYDPVAETGAKNVRITSGWQRTEKEMNVYDFEWIDSIVDNFLARGVEPWITLAYGNQLYTEIAKEFFGAVGCPPILTDYELNAWLNYVKATVKHFKGRVSKYEIWNEPDGRYSWKLKDRLDGTKGFPDGREYGEFAKATAIAIREADEDAYIIGFSLAANKDYHYLKYLADAAETGVFSYLDAISYHRYATDINARIRTNKNITAFARSYNPNIDIIQGESGTQSKYGFAGALKYRKWTEEKQTKHLIRLMITDLVLDCSLVSYFSALDMVEALHGKVDDKKSMMDYGYFGVLRADFDENGIACGTYAKKPSYYALQTIASLFEGDFETTYMPYEMFVTPSTYAGGTDYMGPDFMNHTFRLADGSLLFTYWRDTDIVTTTYDGTATFEFITDKVPELIDLYDGSIYSFPVDMIERIGKTIRLKNIPIRDYPVGLRF